MDKSATVRESALPVKPVSNNPAENKNAANLKKALGAALLAFEKNKEWADYGHWLQKVAKCLEDYPSYQIPEKLTFAKRLSQCLNPNLPPAIHNNTIQVYSLVFRNMKECGYNWCEDLGIYSFGIFPLFQYASFQVKPKILHLFREHYFPLGKQLIPCITGLVVSILPGVEEQNETLQKDVFSTLDQLSECVTRRYFLGAVWMALLRNPRVRAAGIKYLSKRLQRTYTDPEENEEAAQSDSEVDDDMSPQKVRTSTKPKKQAEESPPQEVTLTENIPNSGGWIDASTIKEDAKDDTTVVAEEPRCYLPTAEDEAFLKSLDDEDDEIEIEYPNKSSLVINALMACLEDDNLLVQKACLDFMFSHFKLASDLFSEDEKNILVEAALNLLIKKDQQIQRRVYTWIFGPPDMENKYQVSEKNIKVIDYLIIAFKNIFQRDPSDQFQATLPLKVLQNFYMEHDHLVELTLTHLAIPFLSYVFKYSQPGNDFADEVHKSGARFMENITSYFSTLLTSLSHSLEAEINNNDNQKCLEIINLIEFTFKLEASIANKEENINYIEQKDYLKAIISGILRSTSSISPDQKNLVPFIDTALSLNLNLIGKLEKVEEDLSRLILEKNLSEVEVAKIMENRTGDYGFIETLERFSKFYERLVEQIVSFHTEGQIPQKLLNLFAAASETIMKVQIFHTETNFTGLPSWLKAILQCIKSNFPSVAIIGIKTIHSFLVHKSKMPIYENIKNLITTEGGSKNRSNDIVRRTLEKLWGLLDVHYIQNTVSDLLVTFQAQFPKLFADTVSNSFQVPSITEKEAAIRRFGSFWRMSSDMPKSDFIDSGTGLFIMLDFLDNDNPLLRHSSKSWLLDSIPFLYRIIDPIFEILMQINSNPLVAGEHHLRLYATDTQQLFFTEVYDTEIVQDSFKKLKSILITSNELFIRYIIQIEASERLKNHTQFFEDNEISLAEPCTYLDLLFVLCLRYIQGHAIESLSPKFQIQNASVNASASEFLELLISHIESDELSSKMTHFVMEPLLTVLHHAINNSDYVLQVQLLNLLKVILLQSGFCRFEGTRYKCVALLSSKRFIPNLLEGLNVDQPYVRVQFINFISLCVGVLTEHLPQKEILTTCVISILRAYFEIILNKHLEVAENNDEFEPWDNDNVNFEEDTSKKIEQAGKEAAQKVEENKEKGTKNTFTIRYQSQNEIFILLEGVRKILDFFLKFKPLPDSQESKVEAGPGMFGYMRDLVTFQFLLKPSEERKEIVMVHHSDTCKAILNDLFKIVYILIYCWRLSKEFRSFADFTALGITPYTFEKYNEINKMVKDHHMKLDLNAKNAKALIISVLKPLMFQYMGETVNSFINYWILECQKKHDLSVNPRMMKEIEILVTMNVSAETFISALSKNQIITDLSNYYTKKLKEFKRGPVVLNYDVAKTENQIFFLLYTYIAFSYIDINFFKKEYLFKLWTTALNFTKLFANSKSISTHLWLLEILYLLSIKYNPKEILNDQKLKKDMHDQINALLIAIANTCAKNTQFYFNEPGGMSTSSRFKTVLPFPPTIYEIYKNYKTSLNKSNSEPNSKRTSDVDQPEEIISDSVNIEKLMFENYESDTSEHGLYFRYRLYAFKTLKRVALTLLQNTYSPEKIDRIIKRTKDFMDIIFPMMENKSPENQCFLECASELLYSQLESSRSFLIKEYKFNILAVYNGNDFFKCTKKTLKYWSKIIDWLVSMDKTDLFSEFLTKVSAFAFLYNKDTETKQKIKSFERICFIIYSGERDKYQDKLFILLEKMGEVIKNEDSAPNLLILILFCVRILILRLSPLSLNELFRHIWPILLTLLMQIFSRKDTPKNPNLILAALKLVEMMSIVQLEEFFINQWVFIFDYFGITFEPRPIIEPPTPIQTSEGTDVAVPVPETKTKVSGFIYQPYVANVLQDNLRINYKSKQVDTQKTFKKTKRKIVMTMTNVDDEVEIKAKALFLIQYLIQQNEFRTEVDPHQVESLIEGDFISLDDYILNIN